MIAKAALASEIADSARTHELRMKEVRRYLHRHPELSGQEYRTTEFLAEIIADLGLSPQLADDDRGLFVDIGGSAWEPRIAIRADMDALPIRTRLDAEYASRVDNVMHACGHDVHAAIGFGVVLMLNDLATRRIPIHARVIFQPEEETSRGAIHMIESGALEQIEAAIALHVDSSRPVGTMAVRDGALTAGCDTFTCEILGRGGHGARPHLTGDTVGAAAQWITDVYRRVPRSTDARDAVVLNVGSIRSGAAANVVPASAEMTGTLRSLDSTSTDQAKRVMHDISTAIASAHRCEVNLNFDRHTPEMRNDVVINRLLQEAGCELLNEKNVRVMEKPSMGAEDFAFIADRVPAAMFRLGVAGIDIGHEPLHTPKFDVDESAMPLGAGVLTLAAKLWSDSATRKRNGYSRHARRPDGHEVP